MTPVPGWGKRDLDAEFGPTEGDAAPVVVPSVLSRWFVTFRDDVLSGRVSLEELIDVADFDMQIEQPTLCPICSRSLRPGAKGYTHGICAICWLHKLMAAHLEKCAELEALKEYNVARKEAQRLRDELGILPDRLKRTRDYGGRRVFGTDHPLSEPCEVCGEAFVPHDDSRICPRCRDIHERREAAREGDAQRII